MNNNQKKVRRSVREQRKSIKAGHQSDPISLMVPVRNYAGINRGYTRPQSESMTERTF